MLGLLMYIIEVKQELFFGFSLSILYLTYYLVEAVKRPRLVCRKGEFREFLVENVPILSELYWPTPWCVESRLQTVIGSVLRSSLLPRVQYRRQVLRLSDGGQLALDWVEEDERACAVMLILPGLTGDVQADYVRCLAAAARQLRARCVVFNNRGLGGLALTTPRLYCALSHEDLAEAVQAVRVQCGPLPVLAVGVSLGGLILGHYLAEHGVGAHVQAALVVSSPLDVVQGAEHMESIPLNAALSYHMARNLRRTVHAHASLRGVQCDWAGVERARSVRQFDAAFTTRHFGFASVESYYRAASLRSKLCHVRVPLVCLCAADDPFQPECALPERETEHAERVALVVTARGGHIGFLEGWWPAASAHHQYLSRVALQYFTAILEHPEMQHTSSSHVDVMTHC